MWLLYPWEWTCKCLWNGDSKSFRSLPRSGLSRSYGSYSFAFERSLYTGFHRGHTNLMFPQEWVKGFLHKSPALALICYLDNSLSDYCKMESRGSFNFRHSPSDRGCWTCINFLLAISIFFPEKNTVLVSCYTYLWNNLFSFLFLVFKKFFACSKY